MRSEQPTLEELFAATRALERKASPERGRLRRMVAARLSAAGVGMSAQALAGKAALASATWLSALKVNAIIGLAVVGGTTAGAAFLLRVSPDRTKEIDRSVAVRAGSLRHLTQFPRSVDIELTQRPELGVVQSNQSAPRAAKSLTQSGKDTLSEELALVRGAQSELAKGRATNGLVFLAKYFERFSSGILRPEAQVTRVRALCLLGRHAEAEREARRFVQTNPASPLVGRLQSCKAP